MVLYRLLVSAVFLPVCAMFLARCVKGEERWRDFAQRLGLSHVPSNNPAQTLWLHAASNGELNSVLPLLSRLRDRGMQMSILITCNSVTGVRLAEENGYVAQLAPLDFRWSQTRFLKTHGISTHVTIESEIWPNRIHALHARGIPCIVLGARLSAASLRKWQRVQKIAKHSLEKISFFSAQDSQSKDRYMELGLRPEAVGVTLNLKSLFQTKTPELARSARANTCLAASTHPQEDELILAAFKTARQSWPKLRLIIAPRHPKRAADISVAIKRFGFRYVSRSALSSFDTDKHDILLADTLGEMDRWYAQSGICIIGGTFQSHGGHTPYEPAAYGCAILHGPKVENFQPEFKALRETMASKLCETSQNLAAALLELQEGDVQDEKARISRETLSLNGNVDQLFDDILNAVQPKPRNPS